MSMTMLIPTLPQWLLYVDGLTAVETGLVMGIFAIGLFLPGTFCSYLVQRYRRNIVCIWTIILLMLTLAVPIFVYPIPFVGVLLLRLVQGSAFGLGQMILASTLVIDTCESFQRTEANHSSTWFGRFALSLGPMIGLLVYSLSGAKTVFYAAACCCMAAVLLISLVHFPFRVPNDRLKLFSLDRFFLQSGWPLFLNLFIVMWSVGLILTLPFEPVNYALMMLGFLLALLSQRFVFPDVELKSEGVTGVLLIIAAVLILFFSPRSMLHFPLLGLGLGVFGARFVLFFVKLSRHCQRGTAQSTFILGWESGLAFGIGMGYCLFDHNREGLLGCSLFLAIIGLLVYTFIIHNWYVNHKNR